MSEAYIIWGASGAGKDTQAQILVEYIRSRGIECPDYFSMGKNLRHSIAEHEKKGNLSDSLFFTKVNETVSTGGLLPEFVPISVWTQWLRENAAPGLHYVLNGVARKPREVGVLASALKYLEVNTIRLFILQVSDEEIVRRLLLRNRVDDTKEAIERRVAWYKEESVRGIEMMKEEGIDIVNIDGEGTNEEVFERIKSHLSFQ